MVTVASFETAPVESTTWYTKVSTPGPFGV
jgi:hypothetical protein